MHCNVCKHERNRVLHSRKLGHFVLRLRECLSCRLIWGTVEKVVLSCEECGGEEFFINSVRHDGPDRKIRTRTCKKCGNNHYSIEKRIKGQQIIWESPDEIRLYHIRPQLELEL